MLRRPAWWPTVVSTPEHQATSRPGGRVWWPGGRVAWWSSRQSASRPRVAPPGPSHQRQRCPRLSMYGPKKHSNSRSVNVRAQQARPQRWPWSAEAVVCPSGGRAGPGGRGASSTSLRAGVRQAGRFMSSATGARRGSRWRKGV